VKFIIKKDKFIRKRYLNREYSLLKLKPFLCNARSDIKYSIISKVNSLNKKLGFSSQIKNRCYQTGRSSSVDSFTKLSRMRFRELAHLGQLVGVKKSSW
jgi:ribosomal protein S14